MLTRSNPPWNLPLSLSKINMEKLIALKLLQVIKSQSSTQTMPTPGKRASRGTQLRWVEGRQFPASQPPCASFLNLLWLRPAHCRPFPLFLITPSSLLKRKMLSYSSEPNCGTLAPTPPHRDSRAPNKRWRLRR